MLLPVSRSSKPVAGATIVSAEIMFLVIASPHLGARSARGNTTLPSVMLIAANLVTLPSVILVRANLRAWQTQLDLGWTREQPRIN